MIARCWSCKWHSRSRVSTRQTRMATPGHPFLYSIRLCAHKSPGHHQDWFDCIKSRKRPICDVEIGARSVTVCHLGNLAYWNHRKLAWDPKEWRFVKDDAANRWLD